MQSTLAAVLAPQFAAGLQRIHLSVRPGPGMTTEKVLAEFLAAEQSIADGRVHPAPRPTTFLPSAVEQHILAAA